MKRILLFGILSLTVLVSCQKKSDENRDIDEFIGRWALVQTYDAEAGFTDYYDSSGSMLVIDEETCALFFCVLENNAPFHDGYYDCFEEDFEQFFTFPCHAIDGTLFFTDDPDWGFLQKRDGKIYFYGSEDVTTNYEIYERVMGFKK